MKNHDFNTAQVNDGSEIDIYTAIPDGQGPFPGLIVLMEAFGVNQHIREVAELYSSEGYAVVAPDLFHRTGRRQEIPYDDFSLAVPHFQAITIEGLTADLQASFDFLQQQETVKKDKVGSIGYCLGGRVSFLANAVLPLSAAVSYYGGGTDQLTDRAKELHAPHLFFWGGLDQHIPVERISSVIDSIKAAGKEYTNVIISYADHGFACDDRESYHKQATLEAQAHSLAFLANRLK